MKSLLLRLRSGVDGPPVMIDAINRIAERVQAITVRRGSGGILVRETSGGTSISVERQLNSGGGGSIKQFILVAMFEDYFTANSYSDAGSGSEVYQIAKPYELRKNPWANGSHTIIVEDGTAFPASVTVAYSYQTFTFRRATVSNGVVENQVIIPQYRIGGLIYAAEPDGGVSVTEGDVPLTWLDINAGGRAWSKV